MFQNERGSSPLFSESAVQASAGCTSVDCSEGRIVKEFGLLSYFHRNGWKAHTVQIRHGS